MEEKYILETLKRAEQANMIISSVGSMMDNLSSMERSGYINKEDRAGYQAEGAIGHSLARLIDEEGQELDNVFNRRIVGVSLDLLRKVNWSLGVGANPLKANVFLAAIKGHHFNVLVIDDGTAREILRLMDGATIE
jgi:deoxyribonucleoside regulator